MKLAVSGHHTNLTLKFDFPSRKHCTSQGMVSIMFVYLHTKGFTHSDIMNKELRGQNILPGYVGMAEV